MNFFNPDSVWVESEILIAFAVQMKMTSDSKAVQDRCDEIICQLDRQLLRKCHALRKSLRSHRNRVIAAQKGIYLSNTFFGRMVNMLDKAKKVLADLETIESYVRSDIAFHETNRKNRKEAGV